MRNIVDDIAHLMVRAASSREEFAQYAPAISEFLMNQAQIEAYSRHMRVASTTRPHFWRDGLNVWVKVAESAQQEMKEGIRGTTKARKKTRQTAEQKAIARKTKDKEGRQKIVALIKQWKGGVGNAKNIALKRLKGLIRGGEFKGKVKALRVNYNKLRNEETFKSDDVKSDKQVKFNSISKERQNEITLKEYIMPLAGLAQKALKQKEQTKEDKEDTAEAEGRQRRKDKADGKNTPRKVAPERAEGEGDAEAPAPSLKKQPKSDQEKIKEFMENASPETQARLKKLGLADQMKAIKAIVSMKGGDDEVTGETFAARAAAYRRRLDRY
jgi:hypothetical protein